MLFSSFAFLFGFLPISLAGFHLAGRNFGDRVALVWLLAASAVFYGWWNPAYVALLGVSIVFNYALAIGMLASPRYRHVGLWVGIAANLAALGYCKYAEFLVTN